MDCTFQAMLSRFTERVWGRKFVQNGGLVNRSSSRSLSPYGITLEDDVTGLIFGTSEERRRRVKQEQAHRDMQKMIQRTYGGS